jgi:hypothetical protein
MDVFMVLTLKDVLIMIGLLEIPRAIENGIVVLFYVCFLNS